MRPAPALPLDDGALVSVAPAAYVTATVRADRDGRRAGTPGRPMDYAMRFEVQP